MSKRHSTTTSASGHCLRAGVARSDITIRARKSRIKDPLYAKALVLDDGRTRVAIITMDVTAIGARRISQGKLPDVGEDFLPRLRSRIQKELGIPTANVLVNASHTHPPGRMLCSDREQVERTIDAVRRAARNLTEVRIGAGSGREDRITMNRALRLKDGRHWNIRHSYPSPPADQVAEFGPIDPEIGILRIDRLDGRPLAVVYNFACHLLFGDPSGRITANFPGVASRLIERTLGHGAQAMFVQGAAGDIVDVGFKDFSRPRDVEPLGVKLGQSTLKALRKIHTTSDATLKLITETIQLPRRTDIPRRIIALQRRQAELLESLRFTSLSFESFVPLYRCRSTLESFRRRQVEKYLQDLRAMEELSKIQDDIATLRKHQAINQQSGSKTVAAELQGIRIGNCLLITAPIELLVEIGLRLKKTSPYKPTLVAAFSNGYLHYGPPARDYSRGGYEVNECLLAPSWQRIFEGKANEILRKL